MQSHLIKPEADRRSVTYWNWWNRIEANSKIITNEKIHAEIFFARTGGKWDFFGITEIASSRQNGSHLRSSFSFRIDKHTAAHRSAIACNVFRIILALRARCIFHENKIEPHCEMMKHRRCAIVQRAARAKLAWAMPRRSLPWRQQNTLWDLSKMIFY